MGLSHSPKVVTDGLVFAYDMGNADKSWRGAPTTNLINNPLPNGTTTGFAAIGGVGTLTFDAQNQAIKWVRTSYEVWGAYHTVNPIFNGTLSTSVQYSISFEWKVEGNAFSNSVYVYELVQGNGVSPAGSANLIANSTLQPNGWFLFKYTFTPANAGVGDAYNRIYFPSQSANTSTFYWRKIQFEQNAFATPFVNGTRSNTQAVFDMTKRNTVTATSLTYASNNTFSFNGITDFIGCGNGAAINFGTGDFTVSVWFKRATNATTNLRLLSKGGDSDTASRAGFAFAGSDNSITFTVNPSGTRTSIFAATYAVNEWVNVVGLVERGATMRSYKNGNLVGSATAPVGSVSGDLSLFIGNNAGSNLYWPGEIAQVSMYNKALTPAEILQNFNAHRGRYGI
jgi:hypothetical protein